MSGGPARATIAVPDRVLAVATSEAVRAYPSEACGVLVGRVAPGGPAAVRVHAALAVSNADPGERRFLITADTVRAVESKAAAGGLDVVGFYHSHPDGSGEPSDLDRENAWPWYTYVIVPVRPGRAERPRAWRLAEDRSTFFEVPVTTIEEGDE